MAKKKLVQSFQHSVNLSSDPKIKLLEERFGIEGYGVYLVLVEMAFAQGGILTISNSRRIAISEKCELHWNHLQNIIQYCLEIGLLDGSIDCISPSKSFTKIKSM